MVIIPISDDLCLSIVTSDDFCPSIVTSSSEGQRQTERFRSAMFFFGPKGRGFVQRIFRQKKAGTWSSPQNPLSPTLHVERPWQRYTTASHHYCAPCRRDCWAWRKTASLRRASRRARRITIFSSPPSWKPTSATCPVDRPLRSPLRSDHPVRRRRSG